MVLVIDDDDDTRTAICELLEDHGYGAVLASNGQEADDYLRENPRPDCIVLDLWMPVMDGWRFTNRLQQLRMPPIPIVVVTGAEPHWGYPVALTHVVKKPIHPDAFLATIQKVVPAPVDTSVPNATAAESSPHRHEG
jgi:CheY-like chemotaxis protein